MTGRALGERYVARRTVLLVAGSPSVGDVVERALVSSGVEVHLVTTFANIGRRPGVASQNFCDLVTPEAISEAIDRIGAVVQNVFHCAAPRPDYPATEEWHAFPTVAEAVRPLMLTGGVIVGVGPSDPVVDNFVRDHKP